MKEMGKLCAAVECCEKGFPRIACATHVAVNLKHKGWEQSYCVGVASVAEASEATLWRTATLQHNVVQTDDGLVPPCAADAKSGPINPLWNWRCQSHQWKSVWQEYQVTPGTPRAEALPRATGYVEVDRPARTNRRERFVLNGPSTRMNGEARRRGDPDGKDANEEVNSSLIQQE